jgi:hypothetical protein
MGRHAGSVGVVRAMHAHRGPNERDDAMAVSDSTPGPIERAFPMGFNRRGSRGNASCEREDERALLIRYSLFNSATLFLFAYAAYFLDGFNFLWTYDATRFSFLIIGIYLMVTAISAWRVPMCASAPSSSSPTGSPRSVSSASCC